MISKFKAALGQILGSWQWLAAIAVIMLLTHGLIYYLGRSHEQAEALRQQQQETQAAVSDLHRAFNDQLAKLQTVMDQVNAIGQAAIQARQATDDFYKRLDEEARHDAPAPVDSCELPTDRLHRWQAANAGPFAESGTGTAAGQSDRAAAASAPADQRQNP